MEAWHFFLTAITMPQNLQKHLSLFHCELLENFSVVKKNKPQDANSKFILWNNQNITIDGNPVFWKSWFDSSILFVYDILNAEGNFLSLEEFKIKINFLQYFQLLSAISTDLKKLASESPHPDVRLDSIASPFLKISEGVNLDLKKLHCKNYYKLMNEKSTVVPTFVKTWKKHIPKISADW